MSSNFLSSDGEGVPGLPSEMETESVDFEPGPKIRSRAAWYAASRSSRDFCNDAALLMLLCDVLVEAFGRLSMRIGACNASAGGTTVPGVLVVDGRARMTSGMGALEFLRFVDDLARFRGITREMKRRGRWAQCVSTALCVKKYTNGEGGGTYASRQRVSSSTSSSSSSSSQSSLTGSAFLRKTWIGLRAYR